MGEQMIRMPIPAEEGVDEKAWATASALTNAEVAILLDKYTDAKKSEQGDGFQPHPLVQKTQAYLAQMRTNRNEQAVQRVRTMLQDHPLYEYEMVLLANLMPENAEEAMTIIPSLKDGRLSEAELDSILGELGQLEGRTM